MNSLQAVVFDLDDTLYPEAAYVLSGFKSVALWAEEKFGIPEAESYHALKTLFDHGVRGNTFNLWLQLYQLDNSQTVKEAITVYRDHIPHITPFSEIPALLAELQSKYRLGIISDGYLSVQQQKFNALKLANYFDAVVFSDTWGKTAWKPSVKPFQEVLHQLSVSGEQAVYIGDNPLKDFMGAKQVGMKTIHCKRQGGEYAHLEPPTIQHAADCIVLSLAEIKQVLSF